jgi:hypothetical protein
MTRLVAWTTRRNRRPPTIHLVDNVNAARTICARTIDPATWQYALPTDNTMPLCRACLHRWRLCNSGAAK